MSKNTLMRSHFAYVYVFKIDSLDLFMIKPMSLIVLINMVFLMLCPAFVLSDEAWQKQNIVIVISMDGMRHDYPDRGVYPGFARMEKEGLRAKGLVPTFPSNTFPGHISLATGTTPERHGIIDNKIWDKKRRQSFKPEDAHLWLEAEPIWISAERQGKRAASYFWLGSNGPWQGKSASYFKTPFKSTLSEQAKLDQIEHWLDMRLNERPHLIMAYWHGADAIGHAFGPNSSAVQRQVAKQDQYLQSLQGLIDERKAWSHVTLIVVSDHGMASTTERDIKTIDLAAIFKKGAINSYLKKSNAIAHLNFKRKADIPRAWYFLRQQNNFTSYYPSNKRENISQVASERMPAVEKKEQPPVIHPVRSGDLVLVAKSGYRFSASSFYSDKGLFNTLLDTMVDKLEGKTGGLHGLASAHPDMAAIFFAQGRGIPKESRLGNVNMIDIAPSIADLMGILPPLQATGKSIFPIPIPNTKK